MYATGAGTKRTTIFLFIFMLRVIACLCYRTLKIIIACIRFCTGYTRQDQQIYTEDEGNDFHFANIAILQVSGISKVYCCQPGLSKKYDHHI